MAMSDFNFHDRDIKDYLHTDMQKVAESDTICIIEELEQFMIDIDREIADSKIEEYGGYWHYMAKMVYHKLKQAVAEKATTEVDSKVDKGGDMGDETIKEVIIENYPKEIAEMLHEKDARIKELEEDLNSIKQDMWNWRSKAKEKDAEIERLKEIMQGIVYWWEYENETDETLESHIKAIREEINYE